MVIIVVAAALLAAIVGSQLLRTRSELEGSSAWVTSPSDRFRARLTRVTETSALSGTRRFYTVDVEMKLPDGGTMPIFREKIADSHIDDPSVLSDPERIEEVISWSDDSHHVICSNPDADIRIPVPF